MEAVHDILGASILFPPKPASDHLVDNYAVVHIDAVNDLDKEEEEDLQKQQEAQIEADQAHQQNSGN